MFARKYMLWGAAFGCAFPIVATLVEALVRHGGLAPRFLAAAQRSPLLWIIDSAPIFLGLFARLAGVRQDGLVAAEAVRRAEAVRAADDLAEAARHSGRPPACSTSWYSLKRCSAAARRS